MVNITNETGNGFPENNQPLQYIAVIYQPIEINFDNFSVKLNGVQKRFP